MKKFIFGFLAGVVARHYAFPNSTNPEITLAFTDALKKFNDRLEATEKSDTPPSDGVTYSGMSTPPTDGQAGSEETPS